MPDQAENLRLLVKSAACRPFAIDYFNETGKIVRIFNNKKTGIDYVDSGYVSWLEKKLRGPKS